MIMVSAEKIPGWVRIVVPVYDEDSLILSKQQEETEHGVATHATRGSV